MEKNTMKMMDARDVLVECPDCSRKFSHGNTLGGHKRDHEAMEASAAASEETCGEKPTFPCPICPQLFPTEKALHGHMRIHPDRGWRGMNPPIEAPPASSQDGGHICICAVGSGDGDMSPLKQAQGDGVTGKSRKKLKKLMFPFDLNELPPPDEDEDMNNLLG